MSKTSSINQHAVWFGRRAEQFPPASKLAALRAGKHPIGHGAAGDKSKP